MSSSAANGGGRHRPPVGGYRPEPTVLSDGRRTISRSVAGSNGLSMCSWSVSDLALLEGDEDPRLLGPTGTESNAIYAFTGI